MGHNVLLRWHIDLDTDYEQGIWRWVLAWDAEIKELNNLLGNLKGKTECPHLVLEIEIIIKIVDNNIYFNHD